MSDLKRYSFTAIGSGLKSYESSTGEWIRFEDAETDKKAAVEAERDACAELVLDKRVTNTFYTTSYTFDNMLAILSNAIRARGEEAEHE